MSGWSTRYSYTEENVKEKTTNVGSVYRLIYKKDDKYYVFYVGQTNELKRRLLEHLSESEPDKCIKKYLNNHSCYFRVNKISSEKDRVELEKKEIEEYKPKCNG